MFNKIAFINGKEFTSYNYEIIRELVATGILLNDYRLGEPSIHLKEESEVVLEANISPERLDYDNGYLIDDHLLKYFRELGFIRFDDLRDELNFLRTLIIRGGSKIFLRCDCNSFRYGFTLDNNAYLTDAERSAIQLIHTAPFVADEMIGEFCHSKESVSEILKTLIDKKIIKLSTRKVNGKDVRYFICLK